MFNRDDYRDTFVVGLAKFDNENSERLIHIKMNAGTMKQMGNILVIGPPGGGKTNTILTNLNSWRHSVVCVDLKGSVFSLTANRRKELGQKVYVLDPRNGTGHRFNPVAATPKNLRRELAAELVSITNDDPFWSSVAITMWLACWAAADHAGQPHIPYAMKILNNNGVAGALEFFLSNHKDDPETMKYVLEFYNSVPTEARAIEAMRNSPDRLLGSKWTTVKNSAGPIDNEYMLNIFSGHDLDIEGMFYNDGLATIYIQADETNKRQFNAFARLVIKAIGECLIREGDLEEVKRRPVMFLYDEFGSAPLTNFLDWLNTMRSRDVILVLFAQKLSQLSLGNGNFDFDDENSFHHHIILKPTRPGSKLYKIISEMSGLITIPVIDSEGNSYNTETEGISINNSRSYREGYFIEQSHIELWPMSTAYAVITQMVTEKYICTLVRPENLGWPLSPRSEPLPKLRNEARMNEYISSESSKNSIDRMEKALEAMEIL